MGVVEGGDITLGSMGLSELFKQAEVIDYISVCAGSCDVGGGIFFLFFFLFVLLPVSNPRSYDGARIFFFRGFGPSCSVDWMLDCPGVGMSRDSSC